MRREWKVEFEIHLEDDVIKFSKMPFLPQFTNKSRRKNNSRSWIEIKRFGTCIKHTLELEKGLMQN